MKVKEIGNFVVLQDFGQTEARRLWSKRPQTATGFATDGSILRLSIWLQQGADEASIDWSHPINLLFDFCLAFCFCTFFDVILISVSILPIFLHQLLDFCHCTGPLRKESKGPAPTQAGCASLQHHMRIKLIHRKFHVFRAKAGQAQVLFI